MGWISWLKSFLVVRQALFCSTDAVNTLGAQWLGDARGHSINSLGGIDTYRIDDFVAMQKQVSQAG